MPLKGFPVFRRFQALDKDASPCGACWDRSLIHVECRPVLNLGGPMFCLDMQLRSSMTCVCCPVRGAPDP
eukprot:6318754-Alexandrium_andersonii.AAC.1